MSRHEEVRQDLKGFARLVLLCVCKRHITH